MNTADSTVTTPVAVPEEEFGGNKRLLRRWEAVALAMLCIGFTLFHLFVLNFYPLEALLFRAVHVAWGGAIGFILYAPIARTRREGVPWYDWVLVLASIACGIYVVIEVDGLLFRAGATWTPADVVVGLSGTLIVLEFARRAAGLALPIIAGVFILYSFVGPWMPGVLHHKGFPFERFFTYMYSEYGIFGVTTQVSSSYIILFVCFAAFLSVSRVGEYINDLCNALFGWARGGPAKAAVASGVLFGSISGSAVANVVASGMVTIPMMRKVGYDRSTAAAIEATSSTGGQITPPVLGAGAFLMAEITGIPYGEIALAAVLPALLFYIACWIHVDLHAIRLGLTGLSRSELPKLGLMLRRLYLFAPIVVLVWALLSGYSPFRAGALGIIAAIVVSWLYKEGRVGPRRAIEALNLAARDTVQLVAVCACAGIIVGVVALTGIGGRFSQLILGLAGQSELLAMIFAALISLILGMGMPTTAAYAIGAAVVAPGLTRMGVPPLVAHLFIFYFAVISAITPPVALASFAAAGMAQSDPWKTSWIALKMGLATFLVPFMFFYSPVLLMKGESLAIVQAVVSGSIGVWLLASATEGWLVRPVPMPLRVVLFVAALFLLHPGTVTDVVGLAAGALVYAWQRRSGRAIS